MDTVGKRLNYLIESKGLNKTEFCEKYGFNYASFTPILSDKRALGINIIKELMVVFPTLNINWLIYGTGEINYYKKDFILSENVIKEPAEEYIIDPVEKALLGYLERKSIQKKIIEIINSEKNDTLKITKEFKMNIEIGDENSELFQKLENMVKNDIDSHKLPTKIIKPDNIRDDE